MNLKSSRITDEQILKIIKNNPNSDNLYIKLGICRSTLYRRLKKLNITLTNHHNVCKINQNVFDSIDNEAKAYWLGFIFADGYISSTSNTFELSLSIKDKEHLIKFTKFIGYEHIHENSIRCRFQIKNKHLWNILNNYGCTPRKSLTLKFPDLTIFKENILINHFLRGYVDGDGCIYFSRNKLACSILGTKEFLEKFNTVTNISRNILKCKQHSNNTFYICYGGKFAKNICNLLYTNSTVYLQRKYNRYKFAVP